MSIEKLGALERCARLLSSKTIAEAVGKSEGAVNIWRRNGMPVSELTGKTRYSDTIAALMNNEITADQLRAEILPMKQAASEQEALNEMV